MRTSVKFLLPALLLAPLLLFLGGCSCGFDCSGSSNNSPTLLTLGFSDSLPEDLKEVVIKVTSITFRRSGAEDVVVDTFTLTIDDVDMVDVANFQMNLLDYRGKSQLLVIENLELDAGSYSEVSIAVEGGDINNSYVMEKGNDTLKELNVSDGSLNLKNLRLSSGSQKVTVEFGLAQALEFQSSSNSYRLTTTGIRMENNQTAATLSGQVDSALFDTVSPCDEKPTPETGNRVYLYEGGDLSADQLADVFTSGTTEQSPVDAIAPFAVASVDENDNTGNWEYAFGYLPAGDYTLAFACDTAEDDSVEYDGLLIPVPDGQLYTIVLSEADNVQCNLPSDTNC
jgi:hypothetical protein